MILTTPELTVEQMAAMFDALDRQSAPELGRLLVKLAHSNIADADTKAAAIAAGWRLMREGRGD